MDNFSIEVEAFYIDLSSDSTGNVLQKVASCKMLIIDIPYNPKELLEQIYKKIWIDDCFVGLPRTFQNGPAKRMFTDLNEDIELSEMRTGIKLDFCVDNLKFLMFLHEFRNRVKAIAIASALPALPLELIEYIETEFFYPYSFPTTTPDKCELLIPKTKDIFAAHSTLLDIFFGCLRDTLQLPLHITIRAALFGDGGADMFACLIKHSTELSICSCGIKPDFLTRAASLLADETLVLKKLNISLNVLLQHVQNHPSNCDIFRTFLRMLFAIPCFEDINVYGCVHPDQIENDCKLIFSTIAQVCCERADKDLPPIKMVRFDGFGNYPEYNYILEDFYGVVPVEHRPTFKLDGTFILKAIIDAELSSKKRKVDDSAKDM